MSSHCVDTTRHCLDMQTHVDMSRHINTLYTHLDIELPCLGTD